MSFDFSYTVIIPCLNEEKNIGRLIKSISSQKYPATAIVVADNGSTDGSKALAESLGASVVVDAEATIGGLRNLGVANASHTEFLVFLDADVTLSQDWSESLYFFLSSMESKDIITGNRLNSVDSDNSLHKNWFALLKKKDTNNYINSGHLICSRKLFEEVSGFSKELETAEDHDFCVRASAQGFSVISAPADIEAYHHGYPSTINEFFRREAWHGRGDVVSVQRFMGSKTAILAMIVTCLTIFVVAFGVGQMVGAALVSLLTLLGLLVLFSWIKFSTIHSAQTLFYAYIYLLARASSVIYSRKWRVQ